MRVIFLDIDGVLNRQLEGAPNYRFSKILPELVARLNRLIEVTRAKVVITSSWRFSKGPKRIEKHLVDAGFVGDVIGCLSSCLAEGPNAVKTWQMREAEIIDWALLYQRLLKEPVDWITIDDLQIMRSIQFKQVMPESAVGLTDDQIKRAFDLFPR